MAAGFARGGGRGCMGVQVWYLCWLLRVWGRRGFQVLGCSHVHCIVFPKALELRWKSATQSLKISV